MGVLQGCSLRIGLGLGGGGYLKDVLEGPGMCVFMYVYMCM